jgi:hypothetical protein
MVTETEYCSVVSQGRRTFGKAKGQCIRFDDIPLDIFEQEDHSDGEFEH